MNDLVIQSSIGGYLGLYLGVSLLQVIFVLECFINCGQTFPAHPIIFVQLKDLVVYSTAALSTLAKGTK